MHASVDYVEGLRFQAQVRGHAFTMDTQATAGGTDQGPSPKEFLLSSILGCSGMDVASILKKMRQPLAKLHIEAEANATDTHPKVFSEVNLTFDVEGEGLNPAKVIEAIELSLTKYCGVSAMVNPVSPIFYTCRVNGEIEGRGQARFPTDPVIGKS